MAQVVQSRLPQSMRAATAIDTARLSAVALRRWERYRRLAWQSLDAYVADGRSRIVGVINTSTNTVVKTVGLGSVGHSGSPTLGATKPDLS
jgi:YVTN family beta-propeller protein